jgi:hypothetical protein
VLETIEDLFINCAERTTDEEGVEAGTFGNGAAFVPPYPYTADPTEALEAAVRDGAGPS